MQGFFAFAHVARCPTGARAHALSLAAFSCGALLLLLATTTCFALPPLTPIVFSDTQAPGLASGIDFLDFDNLYFQDGSGPTIAPNGEVAFYAALTSNFRLAQVAGNGIWEHDANGLELVAVSQDHAAGFARRQLFTCAR